MKTSPRFEIANKYPTGRYSSAGDHLRALARDESHYVPHISNYHQAPRLDAIAVPTHRNPKQTRKTIRRIMRVASQHKAGMVIFLCSDNATKEDIAKIALDYPTQRWLAIDWQHRKQHRDAHLATTLSQLSRGKHFNASEKRNFILELARLMGWRNVMFLDDDINISAEYLDKAAYLLDDGAEVVGFNVREFPDHSVVVHASQLANSPIDSFLGTGAMAVRTGAPFLSFFPNSYCNDWLFALLHSLTTDNGLVWAGTVKQKPYRPFRTLARAEREEPGDILAEGLFRLVMEIKSRGDKMPATTHGKLALIAQMADEAFWEKEITARVNFVQTTIEKTKHRIFIRRRSQMLRSLTRSLHIINGYGGVAGLGAKAFAEWTKSWASDHEAWNKHISAPKAAGSLEEALSTLDYKEGFLYGNVALPKPEDSLKRRHILYEYLKSIGEDKFNEAMFNQDNKKFMQEFALTNGNGFARLAKAADRLRYDRPPKDTSIKPVMTMVMFVNAGESAPTITSSVRNLVGQAKDRGLMQLILYVYGDGKTGTRELQRYRNLLVSEIVPHIQSTNVMLLSGLLKRGAPSHNIDHMIRHISKDVLITYWKLGRRPLPGHNFVVVNSKNNPLRAGTLRQLLRHEHAIADKSLAAYMRQYNPKTTVPAVLPDTDETTIARGHIGKYPTWYHTLTGKLQLLSTYKLSFAMWRARLNLPVVDDLAQTVVFHDPRGWTSIQDRRRILGIHVQYRQSLPGDIYGIVRRIAEATSKELDGHDYKSVMVVVTGNHDEPWEDLQTFRESILELLVQTHQDTNIVFTSLLYRRKEGEHRKQTYRIAKAMTRYIYWLENHRLRQHFSWHQRKD
jgi:hypothetical protein